MDYADAAEGIRATLAAYAQALDDGRTEDIVATFCPDGAIEIPGLGTHEGHDALRLAFAGWVPRRPQRHVVVNTHVTDVDGDGARASSDVLFLLKGTDGWSVQLVGRYRDILHHSEGTWRFHRRTAEFID